MKLLTLFIISFFTFSTLAIEPIKRYKRPRWRTVDGKWQRMFYDQFGKPYTLEQLAAKERNQKSKLDGKSLVFKSRIVIKKEKDDEGKEIDKKKIWVSGCRKFISLDNKTHNEYNDKNKDPLAKLKRGAYIEYKLDLSDPCEIVSWSSLKW